MQQQQSLRVTPRKRPRRSSRIKLSRSSMLYQPQRPDGKPADVLPQDDANVPEVERTQENFLPSSVGRILESYADSSSSSSFVSSKTDSSKTRDTLPISPLKHKSSDDQSKSSQRGSRIVPSKRSSIKLTTLNGLPNKLGQIDAGPLSKKTSKPDWENDRIQKEADALNNIIHGQLEKEPKQCPFFMQSSTLSSHNPRKRKPDGELEFTQEDQTTIDSPYIQTNKASTIFFSDDDNRPFVRGQSDNQFRFGSELIAEETFPKYTDRDSSQKTNPDINLMDPRMCSIRGDLVQQAFQCKLKTSALHKLKCVMETDDNQNQQQRQCQDNVSINNTADRGNLEDSFIPSSSIVSPASSSSSNAASIKHSLHHVPHHEYLDSLVKNWWTIHNKILTPKSVNVKRKRRRLSTSVATNINNSMSTSSPSSSSSLSPSPPPSSSPPSSPPRNQQKPHNHKPTNQSNESNTSLPTNPEEYEPSCDNEENFADLPDLPLLDRLGLEKYFREAVSRLGERQCCFKNHCESKGLMRYVISRGISTEAWNVVDNVSIETSSNSGGGSDGKHNFILRELLLPVHEETIMEQKEQGFTIEEIMTQIPPRPCILCSRLLTSKLSVQIGSGIDKRYAGIVQDHRNEFGIEGEYRVSCKLIAGPGFYGIIEPIVQYNRGDYIPAVYQVEHKDNQTGEIHTTTVRGWTETERMIYHEELPEEGMFGLKPMGNTISTTTFSSFPSTARLLNLWFGHGASNSTRKVIYSQLHYECKETSALELQWLFDDDFNQTFLHIDVLLYRLYGWKNPKTSLSTNKTNEIDIGVCSDTFVHLLTPEDYQQKFSFWSIDGAAFNPFEHRHYMCLLLRVNLCLCLLSIVRQLLSNQTLKIKTARYRMYKLTHFLETHVKSCKWYGETLGKLIQTHALHNREDAWLHMKNVEQPAFIKNIKVHIKRCRADLKHCEHKSQQHRWFMTLGETLNKYNFNDTLVLKALKVIKNSIVLHPPDTNQNTGEKFGIKQKYKLYKRTMETVLNFDICGCSQEKLFQNIPDERAHLDIKVGLPCKDDACQLKNRFFNPLWQPQRFFTRYSQDLRFRVLPLACYSFYNLYLAPFETIASVFYHYLNSPKSNVENDVSLDFDVFHNQFKNWKTSFLQRERDDITGIYDIITTPDYVNKGKNDGAKPSPTNQVWKGRSKKQDHKQQTRGDFIQMLETNPAKFSTIWAMFYKLDCCEIRMNILRDCGPSFERDDLQLRNKNKRKQTQSPSTPPTTAETTATTAVSLEKILRIMSPSKMNCRLPEQHGKPHEKRRVENSSVKLAECYNKMEKFTQDEFKAFEHIYFGLHCKRLNVLPLFKWIAERRRYDKDVSDNVLPLFLLNPHDKMYLTMIEHGLPEISSLIQQVRFWHETATEEIAVIRVCEKALPYRSHGRNMTKMLCGTCDRQPVFYTWISKLLWVTLSGGYMHRWSIPTPGAPTMFVNTKPIQYLPYRPHFRSLYYISSQLFDHGSSRILQFLWDQPNFTPYVIREHLVTLLHSLPHLREAQTDLEWPIFEWNVHAALNRYRAHLDRCCCRSFHAVTQNIPNLWKSWNFELKLNAVKKFFNIKVYPYTKEGLIPRTLKRMNNIREDMFFILLILKEDINDLSQALALILQRDGIIKKQSNDEHMRDDPSCQNEIKLLDFRIHKTLQKIPAYEQSGVQTILELIGCMHQQRDEDDTSTSLYHQYPSATFCQHPGNTSISQQVKPSSAENGGASSRLISFRDVYAILKEKSEITKDFIAALTVSPDIKNRIWQLVLGMVDETSSPNTISAILTTEGLSAFARLSELYEQQVSPKELDNVLETLSLEKFSKLHFILKIHMFAQSIQMVKLNKTHARNVVRSARTERFKLLPEEDLPKEAFYVYLTVCCHRLATFTTPQSYGHKTIIYDSALQTYVCGKKRSKKNSGHGANSISSGVSISSFRNEIENSDKNATQKNDQSDEIVLRYISDNTYPFSRDKLNGSKRYDNADNTDNNSGDKYDHRENDPSQIHFWCKKLDIPLPDHRLVDFRDIGVKGQRKMARRVKRKVEQLRCRGRPVLTLNLRDYRLFYGNDQKHRKPYQHCPWCGTFHLYQEDLNAGIGGYMCIECNETSVFRNHIPVCAYCETELSDNSTFHIMTDVYDNERPLKRMRFCKTHAITSCTSVDNHWEKMKNKNRVIRGINRRQPRSYRLKMSHQFHVDRTQTKSNKS